MALINCPECGKEVSDRASACIHCGCPLEKNELNQKENDYTDFYKAVLTEIDEKNKILTIKFMRELIGYSLTEAKDAVENLPHILYGGLTYAECETIKQTAETYNATVSIEKDECSQSKNDILDGRNIKSLANPRYKPVSAVKCPKCGSSNIQVVRRKFSLLTGFATNKVDRVCANCLYKW